MVIFCRRQFEINNRHLKTQVVKVKFYWHLVSISSTVDTCNTRSYIVAPTSLPIYAEAMLHNNCYIQINFAFPSTF